MDEMAYIRGKNDINRHIRYGSNDLFKFQILYDQNQISCYSIKFLVRQIANKIKGNCIKHTIKFSRQH